TGALMGLRRRFASHKMTKDSVHQLLPSASSFRSITPSFPGRPVVDRVRAFDRGAPNREAELWTASTSTDSRARWQPSRPDVEPSSHCWAWRLGSVAWRSPIGRLIPRGADTPGH